MNYLYIKDNKIISKGRLPIVSAGYLNIEVTDEIYNNFEKYIYKNGVIVLNPDGEKELAQKEYERTGNLAMTALDFIEFLKQSGLTSEQIRAYLDNNIELDMQLKYCKNVYFKVVREILPITVGEITITEEMAKAAFKAKNGEIDKISF